MSIDELTTDKADLLELIELERRSLAVADRQHEWGFVKGAAWARALARECIAYYEARIAWDDRMIAAYKAGDDITTLLATRPVHPTPTPPPFERH
jgi:hypothetical protein